MSVAHDFGKELVPSRETSLPPLVEGPVKGELLLHINSLQLTNGPQLGQSLQARAHRSMLSMSSVATTGLYIARTALLSCFCDGNNKARPGVHLAAAIFRFVLGHTQASLLLQVRAQWWGDDGPGMLLQLKPGLGTTAAQLPIRCSAE